ncbi:MAG: type II toxin-antitoxin system VapC family toxin [Caldilineaceae bacterium]|nr:type II toxin-antitoxin system VapC family toxin [Caldilineaceae bacterium]
MIVYWDTSALIKQYVRESGTADVEMLIKQAAASATTPICYVEISATLAKLVRMKRMTHNVTTTVWEKFIIDWPTLVQIQINQTILAQASTLAWTYDLRGYDAIHLASAYLWQGMLGEAVTFATYDQQLWHAALGLGMTPFPQSL